MNNYYRTDRCYRDGEATVFQVTLLPTFAGYAGHFPGNPVAPGVCNIRMLKQCAEQIAGKPLMLNYITGCRFKSIITPHLTPKLQLRIHLTASIIEGSYEMTATVSSQDSASSQAENTVFIEFKAQLSAIAE